MPSAGHLVHMPAHIINASVATKKPPKPTDRARRLI
jgi:hypothetical protein